MWLRLTSRLVISKAFPNIRTTPNSIKKPERTSSCTKCAKREIEREIIRGYEHCFKASFSILLFTSVEEVALTSFIPLYIRLFFVFILRVTSIFAALSRNYILHCRRIIQVELQIIFFLIHFFEI